MGNRKADEAKLKELGAKRNRIHGQVVDLGRREAAEGRDARKHPKHRKLEPLAEQLEDKYDTLLMRLAPRRPVTGLKTVRAVDEREKVVRKAIGRLEEQGVEYHSGNLKYHRLDNELGALKEHRWTLFHREARGE